MELPRALANDISDPRFIALVGRIDVFLDGEVQALVAAYDMDAGTVTRARTDEAGRIIIEGDALSIETVHGSVTVALRPARD